MSLKDSRDRLSMMCEEHQRTWDLSPRDVGAISDVLAQLDGAESEAARLRAALERIHRGDVPAHKIAADALTDIGSS